MSAKRMSLLLKGVFQGNMNYRPNSKYCNNPYCGDDSRKPDKTGLRSQVTLNPEAYTWSPWLSVLISICLNHKVNLHRLWTFRFIGLMELPRWFWASLLYSPAVGESLTYHCRLCVAGFDGQKLDTLLEHKAHFQRYKNMTMIKVELSFFFQWKNDSMIPSIFEVKKWLWKSELLLNFKTKKNQKPRIKLQLRPSLLIPELS